MQIYAYNADDFDSLRAALREKRIIAAMAVFFQVGAADRCLNAVRAMSRLLCLSALSCCFRGDVFRTDGEGKAAGVWPGNLRLVCFAGGGGSWRCRSFASAAPAWR